MTHRKISAALLGVAAVLALSACGGNDASAQSAAPASKELSSDPCEDATFLAGNEEFCANENPAQQGGPASEPADFGNGVTARILSVTTKPTPEENAGDPENDTFVRIEVEVSNNGTEDFEFPAAKMYVAELLTYGANGYDAQSWATYDGGSTELPERLVPGTSATTASEFTLPAAGLQELTFTFSPNTESLPAWTFTGVTPR